MRQVRWSPEQISGWLSEQGIKLSHERIYQMIWDDKRDGGNLWRSLRRRGKRYNKRAGKNAGRGLIPNRIDISERPAIVARKTRLGDWEGDTVVSAGHKGGLLTLVERKTQLAKITKLPRATARVTQKAAVRRLQPIGDFVHTITFDNGKEFAAHQDIAHALKTKIFFATPYHAWERGLNENTNGLIRDFFPKGTDIALSLNPNLALAHSLRGTIRTYSGQPFEAIPEIEQAMRLDPAMNSQFIHFLGMAYLLAGKYETAAALLRQRIILMPKTDFSRALLTSVLGHLGEVQDARRVWVSSSRSTRTTRSPAMSAVSRSSGKRTSSGLPRGSRRPECSAKAWPCRAYTW